MCFKFDPLRFIADHAGMALADAIAEAYRQGQQDAQSEHQGTRIFQEIIVEYPSICVYPDYRGRPYFSIKYTENGQEFISYGTYKPEVLSEYLKEYFMSSAQLERDCMLKQFGKCSYDETGCSDCKIKAKIRTALTAQPEQRWIPVTEKLPGNRVSVIICYREWQQYAKRYVYAIVIGWYARKHSVREDVFNEWEGDCDYDEDEDEFYIQEGWYEFTTQGNADLMNWYINAEVIAWMPLPEPYWKERREG